MVSPIMKYTKPESTGLAPIHKEQISARAVNIPPRACPPDMAVMYFGENLPTIPIKLPPKIALAARSLYNRFLITSSITHLCHTFNYLITYAPFTSATVVKVIIRNAFCPENDVLFYF